MKRTPLERKTPLRQSGQLTRSGPLPRVAWRPAAVYQPLRPVSAKRAAENRQRRAMVAALWPERPRCKVPGCPRLADDVHEPLTRARGGSITDPGNAVPLCRPHHDEVTFRPESELGWAYELGLLAHSWDGAP